MRWITVCALMALASFASRGEAAPRELAFEVWREGSPIGRHSLAFQTEGDRLQVDIAIDLAVGLGPITLYRYRHRSQEAWQGGKLVALSTETNDDGAKFAVRAKALPEGLLVGNQILPANLIPTSYWHVAAMTRSQLLDSQDGSVRLVSVAKIGRETADIAGAAQPVDRYRISGDLEMELLYLPNGEWAGLEFMAKGSKITYRRSTPADTAVLPDGFVPGQTVGSSP
jgi:hypothetical protein